MAKIAVFFAEGFEEIEALTVVDLCRRAGIEVEMVSIKDAGENARFVTGSHGIRVETDTLIADVDFDFLEMLVLPGGMPGTTNLEQCAMLRLQIEAFHEAGRYIAAICAAPGILGRMGMLLGHRAVSYPSVEDDLEGAEIPQTETAVSEHIITGRGLGTAIPFALKIVEVLAGPEKASSVAQAVVYRVYA